MLILQGNIKQLPNTVAQTSSLFDPSIPSANIQTRCDLDCMSLISLQTCNLLAVSTDLHKPKIATCKIDFIPWGTTQQAHYMQEDFWTLHMSTPICSPVQFLWWRRFSSMVDEFHLPSRVLLSISLLTVAAHDQLWGQPTVFHDSGCPARFQELEIHVDDIFKHLTEQDARSLASTPRPAYPQANEFLAALLCLFSLFQGSSVDLSQICDNLNCISRD